MLFSSLKFSNKKTFKNHTRKFKTSTPYTRKSVAFETNKKEEKKSYEKPVGNFLGDFSFSQPTFQNDLFGKEDFEPAMDSIFNLKTLPYVDVEEIVKDQGYFLFDEGEPDYQNILDFEKLESLLNGEVPGVEMDVEDDPILEEMLTAYDSYYYKEYLDDDDVWESKQVVAVDKRFYAEFDKIRHAGYAEHHQLVDTLIAKYTEECIVPTSKSSTIFLRPAQVTPEDKLRLINLFLSNGVVDEDTFQMIFKQQLDSVRKTTTNPKAEFAKIVKRMLILSNYIGVKKEKKFYYQLLKAVSKLGENAYMKLVVNTIRKKNILINDPTLILLLRLVGDKASEEIVMNFKDRELDGKYSLLLNSLQDRAKISSYTTEFVHYCERKKLSIPESIFGRLTQNNLVDDATDLYCRMIVQGYKVSADTYTKLMMMFFDLGQHDSVLVFSKEMAKFKVNPSYSTFNLILRSLNAKKRLEDVLKLYQKVSQVFQPSRQFFDEIIETTLQPAYVNQERIYFYSREYDRTHQISRTTKDRINIVCRKHGWSSPFSPAAAPSPNGQDRGDRMRK